MITSTFRRLLALTATSAVAVSLAACGPDDAQKSRAAAPQVSQASAQPGWSMDDLAGVDPAFLGGGKAAPLPRAVPMRASYRGDSGSAPAYDYGPDPYADRYYNDDPGADDYQWLALASSLGGMLGDAPPDYAFGYGDEQPWVWETGGGYRRYAEPIDHGGYRYYYYRPDSDAPFLVSDPYYSYGYNGDRLVAIYDRSGRVIDARRAERQRQAARDYYARARQMYVAAQREPRLGVAAPRWQQQRGQIAREQRQWNQARVQRAAWQRWDARNESKLRRDWASEALVRRAAERSFAGWQKADFRTPPPQFYSARQRQGQLRKVAEIRRDRQVAHAQKVQQRQTAGQRAQRNQQAARQANAARARDQRQLEVQRNAQQSQAARQQRNAAQQRQAQAANLAQQKHAQAQRAHAQQQAHREQADRAAAARKGQQRAQQAAHQRREQALRAGGQRRQQAAREHQLAAQRANQQRAAKAQEAGRAARQRSQRAAQQKQAQAAQAAQRQAHAKQAAQRQEPPARAAAKQAPPSQAHGHGAGQDHGNGHGHKPG